MPITVPPAYNYQSPLNAVPTKYAKIAPEGPKLIGCEIDWGSMGGPNNCVNINLQNNATLNFSQIVALSIDNSLCGSDVTFVFPDTAETLTIPAYSPKVIVPVFTNQTQFFVFAPTAETEDVTRFSIHNSLPPPIAVPTTQEQNAAIFTSIPVTATGSTQLIPATISGTIETVFATANLGIGTLLFELEDGASTPDIIAGAQIQGVTAAPGQTQTVLDLQQIRVRFQSGLKLVVITADSGAGSIMSINLYYRSP